MRVLNIHERVLPRAADVGALIDGLATGRHDRLWPWERWPPMRLDRQLQVGAAGGHGPIRYVVDEYEPSRRIRFRFTAPAGFVGFHEYRLVEMAERNILQHVLAMRAEGWTRLTWPIAFQPMHNSLIEDSLDKAEREVTGNVQDQIRWSPWVSALRWVFSKRRAASRKRSR